MFDLLRFFAQLFVFHGGVGMLVVAVLYVVDRTQTRHAMRSRSTMSRGDTVHRSRGYATTAFLGKCRKNSPSARIVVTPSATGSAATKR